MSSYNLSDNHRIYLDPDQSHSLDSLEGISDTLADKAGPIDFVKSSGQSRLLKIFTQAGVFAPGLCLAMGLAFVSHHAVSMISLNLLGLKQSPVSPIMLAIITGVVIRNTIGLPFIYDQGLNFCIKYILRLSIALLGLRLSLAAIADISFQAIPIIILSISASLLLVIWIGQRMNLNLNLSCLIAVGTAICGASAIMAVAPVIKARKEEVGYAITVIALLGMLALLAHPFLAHWIFTNEPKAAGLFLGIAIHDTAQVVGGALLYDSLYNSPDTLNVAVTAKLVRNLCMGAVIPLIAIWYHRKSSDRRVASKSWHQALFQWVPLFVLGFIALAAIRSLGDMGSSAFGIIPRNHWENLMTTSMHLSTAGLIMSMGALGFGINLRNIYFLGKKPLWLGLAAGATTGIIAMLLVTSAFL
jgi:uncharacterized integral membrane protein (TIGR00698 family)